MTQAKVKKLYPDAKIHPAVSGLHLKKDIAGHPALISFKFVNNLLLQVSISFREKYINQNKYVADYFEIQNLSIKKYGSPAKDQKHWSQDLFRDDRKKWGTALGAGHLTLLTNWNLKDTEIYLAAFGKRFRVSVLLRYRSMRHVDLLEQSTTKKKMEGL